MVGPHSGNEFLLRSFARSLRARNRSAKTISSYLEAANLLATHAQGRDLLTLARGDIEDFLADQLERHRPTTAAVRSRSLQQLYRWAVAEELIEKSPMAGLSAPSIPEEPVAVLDDDAITRLLSIMNGRGFEDRRDTAIVRLFLDSGMRLSEMAGLTVSEIDLDSDVALVLGKGRRPRACPFGDKTGQRTGPRTVPTGARQAPPRSVCTALARRPRRNDGQRHRTDAQTSRRTGRR